MRPAAAQLWLETPDQGLIAGAPALAGGKAHGEPPAGAGLGGDLSAGRPRQAPCEREPEARARGVLGGTASHAWLEILSSSSGLIPGRRR